MATDYGNYFDFSGGPTLGYNYTYAPGDAGIASGYVATPVVNQGVKNQSATNQFNSVMAGYQSTASDYVNQLQNIYTAYGDYAKQYGEEAQPIIDAMTGDISTLKTDTGNYGKVLSQIQPLMTNGISLPNAANVQNQYMANEASQLNASEQSQKMNAESQGQNPYANTGANRANSLARASGMADAANSGYNAWQSQYNTAVEAQQSADANFAGLTGNKATLDSSVVNSENNLLGANKSILDANNTALGGQSNTTQALLGYNENQQAQQLALGQQEVANAQHNADITQQLQAKMPNGGKLTSINGTGVW